MTLRYIYGDENVGTDPSRILYIYMIAIINLKSLSYKLCEN